MRAYRWADVRTSDLAELIPGVVMELHRTGRRLHAAPGCSRGSTYPVRVQIGSAAGFDFCSKCGVAESACSDKPALVALQKELLSRARSVLTTEGPTGDLTATGTAVMALEDLQMGNDPLMREFVDAWATFTPAHRPAGPKSYVYARKNFSWIDILLDTTCLLVENKDYRLLDLPDSWRHLINRIEATSPVFAEDDATVVDTFINLFHEGTKQAIPTADTLERSLFAARLIHPQTHS